MYLLFSVLSFAVIIISVNKAIDYFSFVTIEKQMMEKADLGEMSFREVLSRHEQEVDAGQMEAVARSALETLKSLRQGGAHLRQQPEAAGACR
ncbi:hypothetical protein ACFTAO_46355 [Paenibacillus rhizoplanae]